ncbi:MAG: hypothetical protein ABI882_12475, partial [Acidobacteriota bacterium]
GRPLWEVWPVPGPLLPVLYVDDLTVSIRPTRKANESGRAAGAMVTIKDTVNGKHPRAVVSGYWAGVTSGSVSGLTDAMGRVVFSSKRATEKGDFIFVVTKVSAAGCIYDPTRNSRTNQSTTNP